jgi:hypothetical protein
MFDLETEIKAWRRELSRAGISPEAIDELAAHLRDEMTALTRSGMDSAEAFRTAIARAGDAKSLSREFHKSTRLQRRPIAIITGLWLAAVAAFSLFMLLKLHGDQEPDLLLTFHIITLTVGYITLAIAGGFGICHVVLRLSNRLTSSRRESLFHGLRTFNMLAALLVLAGLVSGLVWNARHLGANTGAPPYPEVIAIQIVFNLREYGTYAVGLWLAITIALQLRRPAASALVPMSVAGNLLVGLAWFGPFIFWDDLHSYSGIKTFWLVNAVMILHLIFLGLAFVRRGRLESNPREARS